MTEKQVIKLSYNMSLDKMNEILKGICPRCGGKLEYWAEYTKKGEAEELTCMGEGCYWQVLFLDGECWDIPPGYEDDEPVEVIGGG